MGLLDVPSARDVDRRDGKLRRLEAADDVIERRPPAAGRLEAEAEYAVKDDVMPIIFARFLPATDFVALTYVQQVVYRRFVFRWRWFVK